jgi:hypothetical protein
VRVIGLLNFYEEPVEQIASCLVGLERAGVEHVVAVDGAYALYPDGNPSSHPGQHAAIALGCLQLGMGVTLSVPRTVWAGNEVEKRTFLFRLAWAAADPGDWFFVMDADQEVMTVPDDFKERLANSKQDVGETNFLDTVAVKANRIDWPPNFLVRNLFRAQPIHLETNHINYVTEQGVYLWGDGSHDLAPCLDVTDCLIEHRPDRRPDDRQKAKLQYYAKRDEERVERGRCQVCDAPADRNVAVRWRITKIGPVADWMECCESCAKKKDTIGARQLRQMGYDPEKVRIENRNGLAPRAGKARDEAIENLVPFQDHAKRVGSSSPPQRSEA